MVASVASVVNGLSPRLRGNPLCGDEPALLGGSIPAPAGEPPWVCDFHFVFRVYPRACGGTTGASGMWPWVRGLSPRLRGNPLPKEWRPSNDRSIPAPAGEPLAITSVTVSRLVYPRACGGTSGYALKLLFFLGLSPRLRGNQDDAHAGLSGVGSIPAPAGEPLMDVGPSMGDRVYPRACGGT